jgi:hypothetical protein
MSIKLRVSENVKGEVILPVVSDRTLKANSIFTLEEGLFNNQMVQMAIRKGFLVVCVEEKIDKPQDVAEEVVEKVVEDAPVTKKRGPGRPKKEAKVENVKIEIEEINNSKDDTSTNMSAWDAHKKELADKDTSAALVRKQNSTVEKESQVKSSLDQEVDFSDQEIDAAVEELKKSVKKPARKSAKKTSKKSTRKSSKKSSKKSLKTPKVIKRVQDVLDSEPEDISFVDEEQARASVKRHPILGDQE